MRKGEKASREGVGGGTRGGGIRGGRQEGKGRSGRDGEEGSREGEGEERRRREGTGDEGGEGRSRPIPSGFEETYLGASRSASRSVLTGCA